MATIRGPQLVTKGLILALDAGDRNSYSPVEVLIVAGGGSGGVDNGGGGGGGGVILAGVNPVVSTGYNIVVGAGGAARLGTSDDGPGNNGANSTAFGYTAIGGSGGTGWVNPTLPPGSATYTGGSGAGQSASTGGVNSVGAGTGTSGQGNNGGTAVAAYAGGGGGAGGRGGNATAGNVGAGGEGLYIGGLFGSTVGVGGFVAGGGAGGFDAVSGYTSTLPFTRNGTVKKLTETGEDSCPNNTGAGGNGANHDNENSGGGGSGIVLVRYYGPQRATGGTIYSFNGYTVHQFNSNGTFTLTGGATWNDQSGNNTVGTLTTGAVYTPENNGAFVFDGSGGGVTLTNDTTYRISFPSVEVWVKLNVTQTQRVFFSQYSQSSGPTGYGLGINDSTNNLVKWFTGNLGTVNTSSSTTVLANSVWYHVVATYDGANKRIYVNGVLENTTAWTNGIDNTNTLSSIGFLEVASSQYLNGNLACVRVYNRALTLAEIRQNFNATRRRFGI